MRTRLLQPFAMALLLGSASLAQPLSAQSYLTGDFHQHTTYTDGSYTIGHMMSKNNQFGLQWWANSEHGGGFTTNARVTGTDTGNTVYWDSYVPNPIIGTSVLSGGHQVMWRWQMLRDSSFTEILKARLLYPAKTILQSYEMNVPGHEHGSMGLINNQFLVTPNCNPLAEFEFKFDGSDADLTGGVVQGWTKSTATGHAKTLEALTWLKTNYPTTSYLVPAHPERKQQASGGYTIAAFRDMNNAAPTVCFGFESMPGHQKDAGRGGYTATAVGGGTFGGTGYFSAILGGLWDALLSEGRNFWLFANSDSHNEAGDFYPGEYQKNYTYTTGKSAQNIVDGLRSGNTWIVTGDLIDSLIYNIETIGTQKASAVMGSNLVIAKGQSVKITIKARDPQGSNFNTYSSYTNPVLDHIDIIKGKIGAKIQPTDANYNVDNVATTSVIARFDATGGMTDSKNIVSKQWKSAGNGWVEMSLIVPNVTDSMYFRLRGSNLGLNVTNETDVDGNPLADALMGTNNATKAFADLWFYSNPIFVYASKTPQIQLIYTSDSHYGITRSEFQGASNVDAQVVNAALASRINSMPSVLFPTDNGINAGQKVGAVDYVINTGDIANRQEASKSYQSASASWTQFQADYLNGITLKNRANQNAQFLLAPGNHDVSNAIGYYKTLSPATDNTSMVNIYNLMMNPSTPKTTSDYNYTTDKINYSKDIGGVHFMFVTLWPDSTNRIWMANDLASISATMPVVIFTHDQPDIETKHLRNPNVGHTINNTDKFENIVEETCKDGLTISAPSTIEQRGFAAFVKAHPNIKAYFHGNSNWNQYYTYTGPDNNIALCVFRVDSPMKGEGEVGNNSTTDDKKLSYQVISLDSISKNMTVRQCLWNPTATAGAPVQWGASITIALSKADSLTSVANSLDETEYTIPSWTLLKRAVVVSAAKDSASTAQLQLALNGLKPKEMPYNINTAINGSPTSRIGFTWFTNAGVAGEKVEIVTGNSTDFSSPAFSVDATATPLNHVNYNVSGNSLSTLAGIADNSKRSYVSNKALVTGLTPNTTYTYRVGKPGAWSEAGTFTTAKDTKEPFSFVYTTDPQANTVEMFDISQKTTHVADTMFPNVNFWLSCGDLIETSGSTNSEWEYEQFFQTQQDIFLKKPTAYIIGNHDKSTNKNFTYHFNTSCPAFDAKSTTPGSIYSFVYGDALFMALSYEDYSVAGRLTEIADWMRAQVAANPNTKWRIVFYHKTIYTGSSSHQSDADGKAVRDALAPVFDELHIDLALQGHDHIYEVLGPIKGKALAANSVKNQIAVTFDARTNVTSKMGGIFNVQNGTLYFLNNSAGKKKYEPRSQAQMAAVESGLGLTNYFGMFSGRFGQTGNPMFSNITVSTDTIEVKTFEVSDLGVATPFDSFKVVKTTDFSTGMNNTSDASQDAVNLYPVPVRNFAYVTLKNAVNAKVKVYSMTGLLVKSQSIVGTSQIDLSSLTGGSYLLKVVSESGSYTVKFIKE
ncbi:MAG: metallophosphoesterase [Bacteroidales bacterium]|nr:metallophosphoesterase [Bacteroidales bacterium]